MHNTDDECEKSLVIRPDCDSDLIYHQLSEDANNFHLNCVWVVVLLFVIWTFFCNSAYLHKKGRTLCQIYAYCLTWIHANGIGVPRCYLLGSAVMGAFHPLRAL